MSNKPEKTAEHSIEVLRGVHHILDHKHCSKVIDPLCSQIDNLLEAVPTVISKSNCASSGANAINTVGKAICSFDEQLASGIVNIFSKGLSEVAAKQTQAVIKSTGPLSVVIGGAFVIADVVQAPPEKKLERAGRSSAKLALTTGAAVLGTAVLGPLGTISFSLAASFIGEALDPKH